MDSENKKCTAVFNCEDWKDAILANCEVCLRKYMQDYKKDYNSKYSMGSTPILFALDNENERFVDILIKEYNQDILEKVNGDNFLYISVDNCEGAFGSFAVKYLLKKGMDVNEKNENGFTPLYSAIVYGNDYIARILMEYNADPYLIVAGKHTIDYASSYMRNVIMEEYENRLPDMKEPSED